MYKGVFNSFWKCKQSESTFYHLWWTCKKAKKYWSHVCILIHRNLKLNVQLKPNAFLLGLMDKLRKNTEFVFIYDNNSEASFCTDIERLTNTYNGRIDAEIN